MLVKASGHLSQKLNQECDGFGTQVTWVKLASCWMMSQIWPPVAIGSWMMRPGFFGGKRGEASGIDIDWLIGNHYSNRQSRSISTWSLILYHKFIIYSNMMSYDIMRPGLLPYVMCHRFIDTETDRAFSLTV